MNSDELKKITRIESPPLDQAKIDRYARRCVFDYSLVNPPPLPHELDKIMGPDSTPENQFEVVLACLDLIDNGPIKKQCHQRKPWVLISKRAVVDIRQRHKKGEKGRALMAEYGITTLVYNGIINNHMYGWVMV